jgi:hypothetical protein
MGATWDSFIYNDFFKVFDFDKLEKKMIEPVFVPSSEKTNFDATYDLEELLLEEAPLEARARRQKPRERLKEDATDKEIREDELYRMIDTDFRPFDYTIAAYKKYVDRHRYVCCMALTLIGSLPTRRRLHPRTSQDKLWETRPRPALPARLRR